MCLKINCESVLDSGQSGSNPLFRAAAVWPVIKQHLQFGSGRDVYTRDMSPWAYALFPIAAALGGWVWWRGRVRAAEIRRIANLYGFH
jgi:hypothetical protein